MSVPFRLPFARLVLTLSALAIAPGSAAGQSRSVLDLLPTEDRVLTAGEQSGGLSSSDFLSPNDAFLEAWELSATAGQRLVIDLLSADFDAYLYVVGPGLTETLTDDDGAGGCNARVSFTALENGTFRVVASALGARQTGTYTLRLSDSAGAVATHDCGEADPSELLALQPEGRTLAMGGGGQGRLGPFSPTVRDGRPAEAWTIEGTAGEPVSIVMESDAFDAYLYLVGPGVDTPLTDDDGAGDLNARLDVTFPADAPYVVVASTISPDADGPYAIRVEEPVDWAALPTNGRRIDVGESRGDVLTYGDPVLIDGRRGQVWGLEGTAGQRVTIDLVSSEFDAFLYLVGPGIAEPLSDDDGAGDLDARIATTLPEDGSYRIIASALDAEQIGSFTLRVEGR